MEIKLPSRSWVLEVKATLETLIQRYGKMGEAYDPADRPIAVFDWDDTVIFNDVGMGVFYFQIDELQFNFELEEFWNLIPPNYNREVCRANYEKIRNLPINEAKKLPAYQRYRKFFTQAFHDLWQSEGTAHLALLQAQLMVGFSPEEIVLIAKKAIDLEMSMPCGLVSIQESEADSNPVTARHGIRIYQEIRDLINLMQLHGFDVWIVTGACKYIVQPFAEKCGIPSDRVIGIEMAVQHGKFTDQPVEPVPYEDGKPEAIRRYIGKKPVFAAGNSQGDMAMMRYCEDTALLIDCGDPYLQQKSVELGWLVQPQFELAT